MKRVAVLCLLACVWAGYPLLASASYVVTGDYIKILDGAPGVGNSGGPFVIDILSNSRESFRSFCLEKNEYISFNSNYYVTVETYAVRGGGDNNDLPPFDPASPPDSTRDYLSNAAGKLYQTYREGGLGSLGLGWTGSIADEMALQDAIWALEDEIGDPANTNTALWAELFRYAKTNWLEASHNTRVANLWTTYTSTTGTYSGLAQSQLTLVPEPASVAVWGFIASVFGGVFYLRRRRAG